MPASITTFLMFQGQAEEAMTLYTSLFAGSSVLAVTRYGPDEQGPEGTVKLARFSLAGQELMCIDSAVTHAFTFTPAISLFVECADEPEIDRLYAALSDGGAVLMPLATYEFARKFGWVNDPFGVSWQLSLP